VEREKPREMAPVKEAEKSGDKEFSDIGSKEELPFR
jgi:hypothetical protein